MQTLQVIVILAIFLAGVALMMTKKMPAILALPCMGILIAAVAGVPFISSDAETQSITSYVIAGGASRLASTIIVTVFGAIFAKVIQKEGISDAIIRKAAELAGDKPVMIALALTAATALIFTAMSGAGPVIMVAQIAIPLLLSAGIEPIVAASLVLFGLNIGLLFNVSQYQIYVDTIGMDMEVIKTSSIVMGLICAVVTVAYILINVNKKTVRSTWAMNAGSNYCDSADHKAFFKYSGSLKFYGRGNQGCGGGYRINDRDWDSLKRCGSTSECYCNDGWDRCWRWDHCRFQNPFGSKWPCRRDRTYCDKQ